MLCLSVVFLNQFSINSSKIHEMLKPNTFKKKNKRRRFELKIPLHLSQVYALKMGIYGALKQLFHIEKFFGCNRVCVCTHKANKCS